MASDSDGAPESVIRRWVVIDTPACAELRDLASIQHDFEMARQFLLEHIENDEAARPGDAWQSDALWIAAFTMYGRAFGGGVRHIGRASLDVYDETQRAWHEYVIDQRNKFIAHSVNDFEQTTVFGRLVDDPTAPLHLSKLGVRYARIIHLTTHRAADVAELCTSQIADLKRRSAVLKQQIHIELQDLNAEAILALPDLEHPEFDETRVGTRRL